MAGGPADSARAAPLTPPEPVRAGDGPSLCRDCLGLFADGPLDCPACGSIRMVQHAEQPDLAIAHIDCDAFYAAVEKRDDPSLRDQPLIVGGTGGRGVVTTACYIARQFGPRSAMPMFKARELCPQAVVIPPNMAKYREVSRQIRDIFLAATPVIQPVSLDEAYLDLTDEARPDAAGMPAVALADAARRIEDEVGITVSIGLSYNKFLAKLASDLDKPRGYSVIGRAEAVGFLSRLPVSKINGVGAVTARKMAEQGIETIGQLQALSETELVARYGKFGRRLAGYVRGRDERKVSSGGAAKSVSAETTFAANLVDAAALKDRVRPLCDRVAERLQAKNIAGGTVVLKLKTADFQILTRNRQLPHPTQRVAVIFEQATTLIDAEADGRAFRLIGIGVAELTAAAEADPPDLFDRLG
ncbi:MAG: DNA polymerase IV [Rhodospirillaceae bacterium]